MTFGNYVIFLTYAGEGATTRDVMKIVNVLWGARDLDAFFGDNENENQDNIE